MYITSFEANKNARKKPKKGSQLKFPLTVQWKGHRVHKGALEFVLCSSHWKTSMEASVSAY